MKHRFGLIIVLALVLSIFPAASHAATETDPFVTDLIAGRHTDVGDIKIWNDDQFLYVKIETAGKWCLKETHVAAAWDPSRIPQKNGNPIPGRFPYKRTHDCVKSTLYKIPLNKIPPVQLAAGCGPADLYVAVHAVINTGETAWGKGPGFPGKNWGMYIVYPIEEGLGVWANFAGHDPGEPVEGWGETAPNLLIDAIRTAVKIAPDLEPMAFQATNDAGLSNNGLAPGGGFSDVTARLNGNLKGPHQYTFSFAPGKPVRYFTLHMLDYGDWNPRREVDRLVSMTAYDVNGMEIAKQVLAFKGSTDQHPRTSDMGDLWFTGDAVSAAPGEPGNWTWIAKGSGIMKVELVFGSGFDPNIGFDRLCFVPQ